VNLALPRRAIPASPKTRDDTRWILGEPGRLDDDETAKIIQIQGRRQHPGRPRGYITEFAEILTDLNGGWLDDRLAAGETDDQPDQLVRLVRCSRAPDNRDLQERNPGHDLQLPYLSMKALDERTLTRPISVSFAGVCGRVRAENLIQSSDQCG
jgi:hypothetical protein